MHQRPAGRFQDDEPVALEVGTAAAPDQVGRPHEVRDERVARPIVDLGRRAYLLDGAIAHHDDPVGDGERLLEIVGHVDRGDVEAALKLLQLHAHLGA